MDCNYYNGLQLRRQGYVEITNNVVSDTRFQLTELIAVLIFKQSETAIRTSFPHPNHYESILFSKIIEEKQKNSI